MYSLVSLLLTVLILYVTILAAKNLLQILIWFFTDRSPKGPESQ